VEEGLREHDEHGSFDPYGRFLPVDANGMRGHRLRNRIIMAGSIVCGTAVLTMVLLVILNYWALVYAVLTVPEHLMSEVMGPTLYLLVPFPGVLMHVYVGGGGTELVIYFLLVATVLFLSITSLIRREGKHFISLMRSAIKNRKAPPPDSDNSFTILFQLFMALLFFNVMLTSQYSLFGSTPTVPESLGEGTPLVERMYMLANASVYEEIPSRVLLIGLPLYFVALLTGKRDRPWYKYLTGGNMRIGFAAIFFSIFSAFLFGMAHMGWGIWKVLPTFLSGLAFSYIFLRKGVAAAFLFHFLFDYMGLGGEILEETAVSTTGYSMFLIILALLWIHVGIRYFVYYLAHSITDIYNRLSGVFRRSHRKYHVKFRTEMTLTVILLFLFWLIISALIIKTALITDKEKPIADAGEDKICTMGEKVLLNGSASSDNIGIVNYTWYFVYDSQNILLYGEKVEFVFNASGNYIIELKVTDAANLNDTDTMKVHVCGFEGPIIQNLRFPSSVSVEESIDIDVEVEDADGIAVNNINYTSINGTMYNRSMKNINASLWHFSIPSQSEQGNISFRIFTMDSAGNWNSTDSYNIRIM